MKTLKSLPTLEKMKTLAPNRVLAILKLARAEKSKLEKIDFNETLDVELYKRYAEISRVFEDAKVALKEVVGNVE